MDMIDEALCALAVSTYTWRSLPDEFGRRQILKIHTHKMRQENAMGPDVQIEELASKNETLSGAEIGGLVESASSFAFNRHVKVCPRSPTEYHPPSTNQLQVSTVAGSPRTLKT